MLVQTKFYYSEALESDHVDMNFGRHCLPCSCINDVIDQLS